MANTQLEWLDQNRHRNYPLADGVTATNMQGQVIPTSFLCDMSLNVPPLDIFISGKFYISEITAMASGFQLTISFIDPDSAGATALEVFRSAPISYDGVEDSRVTLFPTFAMISAYPEMEYANGELIVGSCRGMREAVGAVFSVSDTEINPFVVHKGYAGLYRIIVEDSAGVEHVITGDLTLSAGDGVTLGVSTDVNTGHSIVTLSEPVDASTNTTDAVDEALEKLYEKLGIPITSINGIAPNDDGSFTIAGLDCTEVGATSNGLTISNPCAKPCCPSDVPADISAALQSLEDIKNRLLNYHETLLNNLQTMQSRLSSLIASRG